MNKKETKVSDLLRLGFGRRRIAKEMQISEWEARALIQQVLPRSETPAQALTSITCESSLPASRQDKLIHISGINKTPIKISPRSLTGINQAGTVYPLGKRAVGLKVACVSDIHYPYQDERVEEIAFSFLKDYKPDIIVWNGDVWDFYAVSQYTKNIKKKMDIQEEIDYGASRVKMWMKELGKTKGFFVIGNHEARLGKLISKNAPSLASLRSSSIENNIDFEDMGIEFIPEHKDLFIGSMLFTHGNVVRSFAGASVKAQYDQFGCSTLIGHTHRISVAHKRTKLGTHTLVENGTLCDFDVEYSPYPNWQHGFTTLEFDGDDFSVSQHLINNYKLVAFGKVYTK